MNENEQMVSKNQNHQLDRIGIYIASNVWRAVITSAIIGLSISNSFRLTMNSDAWFWFLVR